MKEKETVPYEAPDMEVLEVQVEKGFEESTAYGESPFWNPEILY